MTSRSRYDELHDRYHHIATSKAGTRYERLAALIFKALDDRNTVIHDIGLVGTSGVEHQIDVKISVDGVERRILIECKDYDKSSDKVGLSIVRDFFGVVHDLKPDEAFIITCNDYTGPARKFAASVGIKLLIVREFIESDWVDKLRNIFLRLRATTRIPQSVTLVSGNENTLSQINGAYATAGLSLSNTSIDDPVFVVTESGAVQYLKFIMDNVNSQPRKTPGNHSLQIDMKDMSLKIGNAPAVNPQAINVEYSVNTVAHDMLIQGGIAELLIQGFGDTDMIIFDRDLKRFSIDTETGEVKEVAK